MESEKEWVLIDTETTGFKDPIFVVEIGAQRMKGWGRAGEPFRKLLNQNADIPAQASRVHGYTREILERDGESPESVYQAFSEYAEDLPMVAYNLEYDWDQVLLPEWARLGIDPIGSAGFCALRLAQRLLDPVPAGNCKLQTLRQFYRLPERGAHTALGDVDTVVDLLGSVLRPMAQSRGLTSWEAIGEYAAAEWYPSLLGFGKFKGRLIWEARKDSAFMDWLQWLGESNNARSAKMARWYLDRLASGDGPDSVIGMAGAEAASSEVVVYTNPGLAELRLLVDSARAQLAEIEAEYTSTHSRIAAFKSRLFKALKDDYRKRDQLRLVVQYRQQYCRSACKNDPLRGVIGVEK